MCRVYENSKCTDKNNKKEQLNKAVQDFLIDHTTASIFLCSLFVPVGILGAMFGIMYGAVAPVFALLGFM